MSIFTRSHAPFNPRSPRPILPSQLKRCRPGPARPPQSDITPLSPRRGRCPRCPRQLSPPGAAPGAGGRSPCLFPGAFSLPPWLWPRSRGAVCGGPGPAREPAVTRRARAPVPEAAMAAPGALGRGCGLRAVRRGGEGTALPCPADSCCASPALRDRLSLQRSPPVPRA